MGGVLEELEQRDKEYHTTPFISGHWGGIKGFNVPARELSGLYEAFAYLTPGFVIELRVRGPVHSALTGGPLVLPSLTLAEPLLEGFVEVHVQGEWQSVYPDNSTWQEIELRTKET